MAGTTAALAATAPRRTRSAGARVEVAPDRHLRVAQVVTRFIAGAGGVALRGARALDPERYRITVVASPVGSLLDEARDAGMEVVELPDLRPELRPQSDARALRQLLRVLAAGDFDVVHTHSAKAGALGRLAAHRLGHPAVVHTYHGFPFHEFQPAWRRRAYVEVERYLGRITDRFLAVGSAVAAEAVRLGLAPPERLRVIASAVDVTPRPAVDPRLRRRARAALDLDEEVAVVGTVGRLDAQKAPLDMVSALARLRHRRVVLVWIGDGPLRTQAQARASALGLTTQCRFLGERRDVATLLSAFDVFAMSSLYEGLPCAVVEAMACQVPVVATAVNAVPEVVVPGRTGILVPPRRPELLARAIDYLLDHPHEARRMADAARLWIADRFSPRQLAIDLDETYTAALAEHRARSRRTTWN